MNKVLSFGRECLHVKQAFSVMRDAISHAAVLTCYAFQFDPSTEDKLGITDLSTELWAS